MVTYGGRVVVVGQRVLRVMPRHRQLMTPTNCRTCCPTQAAFITFITFAQTNPY
jgi:hypothetical protein